MSDATTSVVVTVLLCLVAPTMAGGAVSDVTADPPDPLHPGVETDRVELIATVGADGDARWRVRYITEIGNDQNKSEAFDELAADIRENPDNYTDRFADRIRDTVRNAENATGREMRATNFEVSTQKDFVNGIVTYSFEWSNFANVSPDGDRIAVGDAVEGLVLNPDTSFQVNWPEGWGPTDVAPPPDSSPGRSVVWRGASTDFGPDQPSVVLERGAATPTSTATTGGGGATPTETAGPGGTATGTRDSPTDTPGGGPDESGGGGLPMGLLALVALVVVGVGIAWWRRPSGGSPAPSPDVPGTGDSGTSTAARPDGTSAEGTTESTAAGKPADTEDPADTGEDVTEIDEELLSNEERVLRLLEERGGRMKQQEVVDELGWTEAKTSQVVSGMREDDAIDSFRLGRENVLTLPDEGIEPSEEDDQRED